MLASRVLLELRQQTDSPSEFSPTDMDFDERLDAIDTAPGHERADSVGGRDRRSYAMEDMRS